MFVSRLRSGSSCATGLPLGMPSAIYVSVLVRSHLRSLAPLPKEELLALNRSLHLATKATSSKSQPDARRAAVRVRRLIPPRAPLATLSPTRFVGLMALQKVAGLVRFRSKLAGEKIEQDNIGGQLPDLI